MQMVPDTLKTPFQWRCPSCGSATTITRANKASGRFTLSAGIEAATRHVSVVGVTLSCPNPICNEIYLEVGAYEAEPIAPGSFQLLEDKPIGLGRLTFYPAAAVPLSGHVPDFIRQDYIEASSIRQLSPKAAATLARRALQGMIRHFWGVNEKSLYLEILAIEDRCENALHQALVALKNIGNIGAHPEKDINVIVDVEPGEVDMLLELLHLLDEEWYLARHQRQERMARVSALAAQKKIAQGGASPPP